MIALRLRFSCRTVDDPSLLARATSRALGTAERAVPSHTCRYHRHCFPAYWTLVLPASDGLRGSTPGLPERLGTCGRGAPVAVNAGRVTVGEFRRTSRTTIGSAARPERASPSAIDAPGRSV